MSENGGTHFVKSERPSSWIVAGVTHCELSQIGAPNPLLNPNLNVFHLNKIVHTRGIVFCVRLLPDITPSKPTAASDDGGGDVSPTCPLQ